MHHPEPHSKNISNQIFRPWLSPEPQPYHFASLVYQKRRPPPWVQRSPASLWRSTTAARQSTLAPCSQILPGAKNVFTCPHGQAPCNCSNTIKHSNIESPSKAPPISVLAYSSLPVRSLPKWSSPHMSLEESANRYIFFSYNLFE